MSSETDTDAGYVHTPSDGDAGSADPGAKAEGSATGTATATDDDRDPTAEIAGGTAGDAEPTAGDAEPTADGFGRKGWALTAVLFVCVLVIPGIIYAYPYAAGAFGLTFFATYLALPLVPAVLLGLVAVWSMTAATE
ncbi:hypothetical protein DQW50_00355 [Halorubrum sp. 48-1-W]|uniref:hypothetical protein n=1 Tax=Halorubrum sp. 48-1-W TaxID=2249761 RepID=UPI000DCDF0CE|nr:hypothetical protein [Halorubrum sp. 48-1-W]RAW46883.1 hypothetical protein DQW50_00355 [Halorubrum sp. 48-1-W]